MAENSVNPRLSSRPLTARKLGWNSRMIVVLASVIVACIAALELRVSGLSIEEMSIEDTPVTVYRLPGLDPAPPVVMAHGFAGSRQMMDQIAVSLARSGFLVASVDLPGHGRNTVQLSPDITRIEGTTQQLVEVVDQVAEAVATRPDTAGPVSYVGHSMATDVAIRASQLRDDVGGVVAISMYSPAVTESDPAALLVLSGATEGHLRAAGLEAVRLIDPEAVEGDTVTGDGVTRRTAVAPFVGHVGVLYAPQSLDETTRWLRETVGTGAPAPLDHSGWIKGVLFVSLVLLVWPLSRLLPELSLAPKTAISWRGFLACLLAPVPVVVLIALLPAFGVAGHASFGTLGAIFAAWGLVQLAILRRLGLGFDRPDALGLCVYLALALLFALALDRYGAAFVPTGARTVVLLGLLIGTVPLMLADTMLVQGASILRRVLAQFVLLAGLAAAMAFSPSDLGLAFTTLPVLLLFFLVFGTMARWVAARRGLSCVALGKGLVLAWAVAASTPLFAVAGLP
ncbi:MAG: alpha/beta fold hydrolase [Pseudomonadota bacterium]